jgi:hypothetical protein
VSEEQAERFHQDIRKWKEDTRVGEMLTWWVTTAGRYIAKFRKPHLIRRATYAASPARKKKAVQGHWIKFNL